MKILGSFIFLLTSASILLAYQFGVFANKQFKISEDHFDAKLQFDSGNIKKCGECHYGSMMSGHNEDFIKKSHGASARISRKSCLACHKENKDCLDCHIKTKPEWATDRFMNPQKDFESMHEHIKISKQHKNSCKECHTHHFVIKCGTCHLQDELWSK